MTEAARRKTPDNKYQMLCKDFPFCNPGDFNNPDRDRENCSERTNGTEGNPKVYVDTPRGDICA